MANIRNSGYSDTMLLLSTFFMNPIFAPLPVKTIKYLRQNNKRVLFFNPEIVYQTQPVNIYKRIQASLEFIKMFPPKLDKTCACGCGKFLTGRRTRWATTACTAFAIQVWEIIDGRQATIKKMLALYHGGCKCVVCNSSKQVKLDHIVPVKLGGGGCWLNNYQLLCHNCHVQKTNLDFGWKQNLDINNSQTKLPQIGSETLDA